MAMNKAEKALLEEARVQAALRWTEAVAPDVPPPEYGKKTTGYLAHARDWAGAEVRHLWSSSVSHGPVGATHGSQGSRALHSTPERALRALRYELEVHTARKLRSIDIAIEKARSGE